METANLMDMHRIREMLETKIETQNDSIKKILTALVGNDLMTNGGIVQDIKEMKSNDLVVNERLKALEEFKNRFYWTAAILSCIFTMVGGMISFIFMYLNYSKR